MTGKDMQRQMQGLDELIATLDSAKLWVEEIRDLVRAAYDGEAGGQGRTGGGLFEGLWSANEYPRVDAETLSVAWAGKSCYLGSGVLFRLLTRLSRRPNRFVPRDDLLRDVWEGDRKSPDTIRSTIHNLKKRLHAADMGDLAAAIQSDDGGYGLVLRQCR